MKLWIGLVLVAVGLLAGPVRADEVSVSIAAKLTGDNSGNQSFSILRTNGRLFFTAFELDPNPSSSADAKRGFFLPANGGSKCYSGPLAKSVGMTYRAKFCVELVETASSIRFAIQKVETHIKPKKADTQIWNISFSGNINIRGSKCTVTLDSFVDHTTVGAIDLGIKKLVRNNSSTCSIY